MTAYDTARLFAPAKRTRSFEDVVQQIREAVVTGRLKEGERLPNERDLCRIFGISRPTLREGLRTLEAIGVIEIRPGSAGGIFACAPDGDQVGQALEALIHFQGATAHDLAEFRVSFEGENANWAAERRTAENLRELDRLVTDISALVEDEGVPWPMIAALDLKFHEAVARATKNHVRLAIMLGISRAFFRTSESLAPVASVEMRRSIGKELGAIADAVRARDRRLARNRMRGHVRRFSNLGSELEERATTEDWRPRR